MKKLIKIFSLLILFGCSIDNSTFEKDFILKESLELDHKILKDVNYYHYHFETDSLLTFFKDHKIIALNLKTGEEKFRINLPTHNEFVYRDHLYHNPDSIFVCSLIDLYDMCILLMNSQGVVYNKWKINELAKPIPGGYFRIDANHSHPMVLKKKNLFFQAYYRFEPGKTIDFQTPIEVKLNLSDGHICQIGDLPKNYKNGDFYGNHQQEYSRVLNDKNELVFSFPSCHDIYVYDSSGLLLKTIECRSHFIDKIETINKNNYKELSAIIDAYTYNAQYSDLVYDKHNKIYYRIALHKLDKFNKNNQKSDGRKRKWSIIMFDNNFNKLGEILMPVGVYWKRLIFTEKGLMLKLIYSSHINDFQIFKQCKN